LGAILARQSQPTGYGQRQDGGEPADFEQTHDARAPLDVAQTGAVDGRFLLAEGICP